MADASAATDDKAKAWLDQIISEVRAKDPVGVKDFYDNWSEQYDRDVQNWTHGYTHPQKIAKIAEAHLEDKESRILDVCAGTGLGGLALKQLGFTSIDAIDGSPGMLKVAAQKQVYKNLFQEIIGHDVIKSVEPGSYAAVVTSGTFSPGHLGTQHLQPLLEAVQSGGYFFLALRQEYLRDGGYLKDLEPTMDRMEADGVWAKVRTGVMEHYFNDQPGKFYVYKKN